MFEDIGIFIDSGWDTVPYDSIRYNSEGKKIALPPIKWNDFKLKRNTKRSKAGALICGDILVVDCDSVESTLDFLAVLGIKGLKTIEDLESFEDLEDRIGLIVKTTRGYHFYFENQAKLGDTKFEKIDIQASNKKLVYLPSSASEGKKVICANTYINAQSKRVIKLTPTPKSLIEWIENSKKDNAAESKEAKKLRYFIGTPLARIEKGSNLFFKRLTPKSYRLGGKYKDLIASKGFLHPNDIQDGDGNDYFTSIAGILCSDITIDVNSFWEIVEYLNSQWDNPLSKTELHSKLVGYVDGNYPNCPFEYDQDWEKLQYSFVDIDGNDITMVYDLKSSKYVVANLSSNEVLIKNSTDAVSYYANRTGKKINAAGLASILPGVALVFNPLEPFGLSSDKKFNTYKHSKYLEILNSDFEVDPTFLRECRKCKALPFFEHLFKDQTGYFLSFLKTKFTTFAYSPTTFCLFDDEGGAGKGALEVFLGRFIGGEKVTRIPYDSFNSKFTSEYEGKLVVFFNEFPDDYKARKSNTDKIKEITGSPRSKIEKKGQDPYETDNLATFFITSNRISLEIKEGDRRFCVVQCDKKFDDVFPSGYFDEMTSDKELEKLAFYLKHFVKVLEHKDYMSPPNSIAKELFVDCNESELDTVIRYLIEKDYDSIYNLNREIINAKFGVINLTKLAEFVGVKTRTLTQGLRKKIGQGKLAMDIKKDTNKMYGDSCDTYGVVELKDLAKFLTQTKNFVKSVKI